MELKELSCKNLCVLRALCGVKKIIEGASRKTKPDYSHFLYIARGSLAEVGYYIHLSKRLGFISSDEHMCLNELQQETASTLYGLIKSVEEDS